MSKKLTGLPIATATDGTEKTYIVQDGVSKQVEIETVIGDKLDKGNYTGTAEDLKSDINGAISGFRGTISTTDPTPTVDGVYKPQDEGTYPNGLSYNPSTTDANKIVYFILSGGVWTKDDSVTVDAESLTDVEKDVLYQIEPYVKLEHKNLYDIRKVQHDKYINSSGVVSNISGAIISDYIEVDDTLQYTISSELNMNLVSYKTITFLAQDKTTVIGNSYSSVGGTVLNNNNCNVEWIGVNYGWKTNVLPVGTKYMVFGVKSNVASETWKNFKLQAEVGNERTDYDDRQSIPTIQDVDSMKITTDIISNYIPETHKNLFDKFKVQKDKYIKSSNGVITNLTNAIVSDFIPVNNSNVYVITSDPYISLGNFRNLSFFDDSNTSIAKSTHNQGQVENTNCDVEWISNGWKINSFPSTAKYLVFQVINNAQSGLDWEASKIQMEVGIARTEYDDRAPFVTKEKGVEIEEKQEADYNYLLNLINNASATPSRWGNTRYASFGDSITWYDTNGRIGYQTYLNNAIGFSVYTNPAISGLTAAENTVAPNSSLINKVSDYDYTNYDVITIALGTNDFKRNVPIGLEDSTNNNDFYGAFNLILNHIFNANKNIRVVLLTPFQRVAQNTPNSEGHILLEYVDAILKIGEKYSCPVIDCYRNAGINSHNLSIYTDDGLHLVNLGYEFAGKWIASQFKDL